MDIDYGYVYSQLDQMRRLLTGLHTKMKELEDLRSYEDTIGLGPEENPSGLEVHIGLAAELIENVTAAVLANRPTANVRNHRKGDAAEANATKREKFHNAWIKTVMRTLAQGADSQIGLGMAVFKCYYNPWPSDVRRKKRGETDKDYLDRQKALKQYYGPPFGLIDIHPMSFFFRQGPGGQVTECIEHSYKFKLDVYGRYVKEEEKVDKGSLAASVGQPDNWIQALPADIDTTTMVLVDEYLNTDLYQLYVDGDKIFEESTPGVKYHIAGGKVVSSKDPDKWAVSVAEPLRVNEPVINMMLTRMGEGTDLLVKRRLALEVPEGGIVAPGEPGEDTDPTTISIQLRSDAIETLPAGTQIRDPFEGAYHVYDAMPFINMMLGILAQHGTAPIFKGFSQAGNSGYKDNSLYEMAKAQFQYIIDSYQECIANIIKWNEWCLVNHCKQEVYCDEYSLSPSDITDWPATIEVTVKPSLPNNFIATGEFYDRMHQQGHITRNRVREYGIGLEHPEEEAEEVLLEQIQEALKPILIQDVVASVLKRVPPSQDQQDPPNMVNGMQRPDLQGSDLGRELGGFATAGRSRMPSMLPNETLPSEPRS